MLSLLLMIAQTGVQQPVVSDEDAVKIAKAFASQFSFKKFELKKLHQYPSSDFRSVGMLFEDELGNGYWVYLDAKKREITSIYRRDGSYNGNFVRAPSDRELNEGVRLLLAMHGGPDFEMTNAEVLATEEGEELLYLSGQVLFGGEPLMLGRVSKSQVAADQEIRRRINYFEIQVSAKFSLQTMRPAYISIKDLDYTVDRTPPKANVIEIEIAADRLAYEYLDSMEKSRPRFKYSEPALSEPKIVQLVQPGNRIGTLCYLVTATIFVDRGFSANISTKAMYFDGQTGEVIPSGIID